jgi:hypothetical protein
MIILVLAALFLTLGSSNSTKQQEPTLPELNKIKTVTLAPAYSCRSEQDFRSGYEKTALFLSGSGLHGPDLLFNGACGSPDYFEGATAGDDMSLIADLGTEPLENITASRVFNLKRVASFDLYSKFAEIAKVQPEHTYALLIDKRDVRGLLVLTVVTYEPNKKVELRYAVKNYQLLEIKQQSLGFNWDMPNQPDCVCK